MSGSLTSAYFPESVQRTVLFLHYKNLNREGRRWDELRESSMAIYTLPCVKQTAGGGCCTARGAQLCDDREGWGGAVAGRVKREGIYVYLELIRAAKQKRT